MPAQRVDYVPLPYVRQAQTDRNQYGVRLADLMRQRGDQQAAMYLRQGEIAAQGWANAGNVIDNAVSNWRQQAAERRRRTLEDADRAQRDRANTIALDSAQLQLDEQKQQARGRQLARDLMPLMRKENGLVGWNLDAFRTEMEAGGAGDMWPEIEKGLLESEAGHLRVLEARRDAAAGDAYRLLQGGADKQAFDQVLDLWKANESIDKPTLTQIRKMADTDEGRQRALAMVVQASPRYAELFKPQPPIKVGTNERLVDPRTGDVMLDAQPPEPRESTNIEQAILRAQAQGDEPTVQRLLGMKKDIAAAGRAPASAPPSEPLVSVIDPVTQQTVLMPRSKAAGMTPASNREQTSTGAQKRVFQFFQRAKQAEDDLDALESTITDLGPAGQVRLGYGGVGANWIQTEEGQRYRQAQRAFTEARLRKDSGAAIPDQEFENDRRTFFAQPGDSKETLEQKRRARANILSSLAFESGRAVDEYYGDEASSILGTLRERAGTPPKKAPATADGDGWTNINGFKVRVKP